MVCKRTWKLVRLRKWYTLLDFSVDENQETCMWLNWIAYVIPPLHNGSTQAFSKSPNWWIYIGLYIFHKGDCEVWDVCSEGLTHAHTNSNPGVGNRRAAAAVRKGFLGRGYVSKEDLQSPSHPRTVLISDTGYGCSLVRQSLWGHKWATPKSPFEDDIFKAWWLAVIWSMEDSPGTTGSLSTTCSCFHLSP